MQAITDDLLRELFAKAETVEDDERRAARKAEAERLARIDAQIRASAFSAPVWLDASTEPASFLSRSIFVLGLAAFGLSSAAGLALLLEKSARNTAETIHQIEQGRTKW